MATTSELLSIAAAVVSAVGGAFSAWAAFRSAGSARVAQEEAAKAGRRAALRQVSETAGIVISEVERIQARGPQLQRSYHSLFALSGGLSNSRLPLHLDAVDKKVKKATALAEDARLFTSEAKSLIDASIEDIDRVQIRLSNSVITTRGVREDLEREESSVEAQVAERRESNERARIVK